MPELPEAERARLQIERVVGREIAAVDDRDTYVCRPHAPGEIAAALTGRTLTSANRRGKFLWCGTADDDRRGLEVLLVERGDDEPAGVVLLPLGDGVLEVEEHLVGGESCRLGQEALAGAGDGVAGPARAARAGRREGGSAGHVAGNSGKRARS